MKAESYICQCCGGRIDPKTMTCDYCGTAYKKEHDNLIRIETFHNPVQTFAAQVAMDPYILTELGPKEASKVAMNQLVDELSKCIAPMMEVYSEYRPEFGIHVVNGRIKVVQPVHRGGIFE